MYVCNAQPYSRRTQVTLVLTTDTKLHILQNLPEIACFMEHHQAYVAKHPKNCPITAAANGTNAFSDGCALL